MADPTVTTSLLELTPNGPFPGEIHYISPAGGMITLRGPSGAVAPVVLQLPVTTPSSGDYLRVNGGGQLYWDPGCSGCGGGTTTPGGPGGPGDPGGNGIIVRTAPNVFVARNILPAQNSPIVVTNSDGVSGDILLGWNPRNLFAGQYLDLVAPPTPPPQAPSNTFRLYYDATQGKPLFSVNNTSYQPLTSVTVGAQASPSYLTGQITFRDYFDVTQSGSQVFVGLDAGNPGDVLTWDGPNQRWKAQAPGVGAPGGGSGTPGVLTQWATPSTIKDSALSQDLTGNKVSTSGPFSVAGTLTVNTNQEFQIWTTPLPGGAPSGRAWIYWNGGPDLLLSTSGSAYKPISSVQVGNTGAPPTTASSLSIGKTGMLSANAVGNQTEIFLTPGLPSDGGKVMLWSGSAWTLSAVSGGPGGGVAVAGTPTVNTFAYFSGANLIAGGPLAVDPATNNLAASQNFFASGSLNTNQYVDMTGPLVSPSGSIPVASQGHARITYSLTGNFDTNGNAIGGIVASVDSSPWTPINTIAFHNQGTAQGFSGTYFELVKPLTMSRGSTALQIQITGLGANPGDVLTWNATANQWQAKQPIAASGFTNGETISPGKIAYYITSTTLGNATIQQAGQQVQIVGSGGLLVTTPVATQSYYDIQVLGTTPLPNFPPAGTVRIAYNVQVSPNQLVYSIGNSNVWTPIAGSGLTASSPTAGQISYFVNSTTLGNSTLFQSGTQILVQGSAGISITGPTVTSSYYDILNPGNITPLPGTPATGTIRIAYDKGPPVRLVYSIGGSGVWTPFAASPGFTAGPSVTTGRISYFASGTTLTDSTIFQNGTQVRIDGASGLLVTTPVVTQSYYDIQAISGLPSFPLSGTVRIAYQTSPTAQLVFSIGGSNVWTPITSGGPSVTGTFGYVPSFNSSGQLSSTSLLHQDTSNYRMTFGQAAPSDNTSWLCYMKSPFTNANGLALIIPRNVSAPGNGQAAIAVSRDPVAGDTTFLVDVEGNLGIIRRIQYIWPNTFPSNGQSLKILSNTGGANPVFTLAWG